MPRCVAFLRGINVGGHRLIPMEKLREIFTNMGLENVRTYIQSGNVIFDTQENADSSLERKVEEQLRESLGYEVPALIRTQEEITQLVRQNPFEKEMGEDMAKLYVIFLAREPEEAARAALLKFNGEKEKYHFGPRAVYCLLYKEPGDRFKFAMDSLEKILKVAGTNRNWATVNKVLDL